MHHSTACCTIPPVVGKTYTGKGEWATISDLKTYITGPQDSTRAILYMYDVYGFASQNLQAADLMAAARPLSYLVIMPDWFQDQAAQPDWLPPRTAEHHSKIDQFFKGPADLSKTMAKMPSVLEALHARFPGVEKWAIVGFCWGGKIAALSSQKGTSFCVSAQSSPAFLDAEDAKNITIPSAMLASNDEDREEVRKYGENLKVEKYVEFFVDYPHGWMTTRTDLEDDKSRAAFTHGYEVLLRFFNRYTQ